MDSLRHFRATIDPYLATHGPLGRPPGKPFRCQRKRTRYEDISRDGADFQRIAPGTRTEYAARQWPFFFSPSHRARCSSGAGTVNCDQTSTPESYSQIQSRTLVAIDLHVYSNCTTGT